MKKRPSNDVGREDSDAPVENLHPFRSYSNSVFMGHHISPVPSKGLPPRREQRVRPLFAKEPPSGEMDRPNCSLPPTAFFASPAEGSAGLQLPELRGPHLRWRAPPWGFLHFCHHSPGLRLEWHSAIVS